MLKSLIDTDILSEYFKGHDQAVAKRASAYASRHGFFSFTSVTVHEIIFGLKLKNATSQLAKVSDWFNRNEQITPTSGDFLQAALIRSSARSKGQILQLADCLIASVALRLDLPLVTGNTGDFVAIQATGAPLKLDNWRIESTPANLPSVIL